MSLTPSSSSDPAGAVVTRTASAVVTASSPPSPFLTGPPRRPRVSPDLLLGAAVRPGVMVAESNKESVYDVERNNRFILESYQYSINNQQQVRDLLEEINEQRLKRVELGKRISKMRDEKDDLVEVKNKLKEERKLLKADKADIRMTRDQFRRDGMENRNNI